VTSTISCTFFEFPLDKIEGPTNERLALDSFKWAQVEMKENYGLVILVI
jgi:hypothetical protein